MQIFSSLKIYNYRIYFIGQAISLSGTWMQVIAQDWLVLKLSNSGTMLGVVTALQFIPNLLLGPIGGIIADRYNKRKILYCTQISACILALILGILVSEGVVKLWMIFILAPCLGLINTIESPTRQTFVFEMVGKDQLTNAVALNSTLVNLARVIGPSIAGVIIATFGIAPCFMLNAISYIPVIFMLFAMKRSQLHHVLQTPKAKGQLREGFSYVLSNPTLRDTLVMMMIIGTFSYEFSVVLPVLAQFTFHGNAGSYAALTSSIGIGSVIGGLITASRKNIRENFLVYAALLFGISILVAAIAPNVYIELAVMVIVGVFSITFIAVGNTTLQLESKPEMRGRVMSLWTMAFLGTTPIGGPIIGWICEKAGPRWGLVVGGIAAITAAWIRMRSIKKEQQAIPEEINRNKDEALTGDHIRI